MDRWYDAWWLLCVAMLAVGLALGGCERMRAPCWTAETTRLTTTGDSRSERRAAILDRIASDIEASRYSHDRRGMALAGALAALFVLLRRWKRKR